MYGLAADAKIDGLLDRELVQIAVGRNEVILRFVPEASVMITSEVAVSVADADPGPLDASTDIAAAMFPFLGVAVTGVKALPPGTLRLEFGTSGAVEIFDSWPSYESYTIAVGDELIVV